MQRHFRQKGALFGPSLPLLPENRTQLPEVEREMLLERLSAVHICWNPCQLLLLARRLDCLVMRGQLPMEWWSACYCCRFSFMIDTRAKPGVSVPACGQYHEDYRTGKRLNTLFATRVSGAFQSVVIHYINRYSWTDHKHRSKKDRNRKKGGDV